MWRIVHQTFEESVGDSYPVLEHIFYGKTRKEALRYYQSHLKSDEFFRDCELRKKWNNVRCYTRKFIEEY